MIKLRYRHVVGGEVVNTDVWIGSRNEWSRAPEAGDGEWLAHPLGRRRVLALRAPTPDVALADVVQAFDA